MFWIRLPNQCETHSLLLISGKALPMRLTLLALTVLGFTAVPALAHGNQTPCNPYYIMQKCNPDGTGCKAHMHYAKGQGIEDRPVNYWYRKPHRWHYHDMFGNKHKTWESGGVKFNTYKRECVPHQHGG